jgi:tetratricopeptide (TPR) repeat protein
VLLNTGNLDEAVQAYKAAIAINSKIYDIHLGLGVTYKALNENDQAVEELLAAYALNPNDPDIPTEIARTYANAGQFGKAVQYAEQAVKVKPEDPRLHGNLGTMYYRSAELDKAIPELSLAIKGGTTADNVVVEGLPLDYGRVAEYYWFYGFALAKSSRCAEAVPIFQALLTGVPDYQLAVDNANAGLDLCLASLTTATPTPKVTPKATQKKP